MVFLKMIEHAKCWNNSYYLYFELWFKLGDKAVRVYSTQVQGNKWILLEKILRAHKWKYCELGMFQTEITEEEAKIIKLLKELRGRFPMKYVEVEDMKELLGLLEALKIAKGLK